jgi:hypothetical protein
MRKKAEGDFWERSFDNPKAAKIGCLTTTGGTIATLCLALTFCSVNENTPAPVETHSGPDEVAIVTECDFAVRRSLKSSSSFDPDRRWTFQLVGTKATVTREFEATNGFGAPISAVYHCEWDEATKRITSLGMIDRSGNGAVVR